MPRIVFWNVNNTDLSRHVCSITESTGADVVVLIENRIPAEKTLHALRTEVSPDFYYPSVIMEAGNRLHCFCKKRKLGLSEIHYDSRYSVRKLRIGQHMTSLFLVHGVDIRNYDPETRQSVAQALADSMRFIQTEKKTNKIIALGDFNMNPFDKGMNLAMGLNAMMTRSCVERGHRRFLGKDYDFYFNPMWGLFGDNTAGPAGTIYDTSSQGVYGWSMLDQVIIHHSAVSLFNSVEILTETGHETLMDNMGRPDKTNASDHFPILVNFREDNDE